jgi:hypothetical protein
MAFIILINDLIKEIGEFSIASDKVDQQKGNIIIKLSELEENSKWQKSLIQVFCEFLEKITG